MKRSELSHVLRAACEIVHDPGILVIGSQSILGSFSEEQLPPDATMSIEADVAFFDDPGGTKADRVDGAIGELSPFHEHHGIYGRESLEEEISFAEHKLSRPIGLTIRKRSWWTDGDDAFRRELGTRPIVALFDAADERTTA